MQRIYTKAKLQAAYSIHRRDSNRNTPPAIKEGAAVLALVHSDNSPNKCNFRGPCGVARALDLQHGPPKSVRGNWPLWSPVVSRGIQWSPVVFNWKLSEIWKQMETFKNFKLLFCVLYTFHHLYFVSFVTFVNILIFRPVES